MDFTAFEVLFLEHWRLFCVDRTSGLPRYGLKRFRRRLNWVYDIRHSIFRTMEVILRRLELRLPRYGRKCLFTGFKIGFTAFAVLYL